MRNNADKMNTGFAIVFCVTLTFYWTRATHGGLVKTHCFYDVRITGP